MLVTFLDINTDKQEIKLCFGDESEQKTTNKNPGSGVRTGVEYSSNGGFNYSHLSSHKFRKRQQIWPRYQSLPFRLFERFLKNSGVIMKHVTDWRWASLCVERRPSAGCILSGLETVCSIANATLLYTYRGICSSHRHVADHALLYWVGGQATITFTLRRGA